MPGVRIVTDSAAALDQETIERLGIIVLPLKIQLGSETFREGTDISPEQFLARLGRPGTYPTTISPTVADFHRVYDELSHTSSGVLSLHVSDQLEEVVGTARRAKGSFVGRCRIEVMDCETISHGQGILVKAAAEAAAAGKGIDDVVRLMRGMIPHVYSIFFVETLDFVEHDGRIGEAQALLGTMLRVKPLLTVEDGDIIPLEKVRTRELAVEKLLDFIAEFSHIEELAILQNLYTADTRDMLERLELLFPNREVPIYTYGPSLAVHLGPTAMGAVIYEGLAGEGYAVGFGI